MKQKSPRQNLIWNYTYIIEELKLHLNERENNMLNKLIQNFEDGIINEFMLGFHLANEKVDEIIINWFAACTEARKRVRDENDIHSVGFTEKERQTLNELWTRLGGQSTLTDITGEWWTL